MKFLAPWAAGQLKKVPGASMVPGTFCRYPGVAGISALGELRRAAGGIIARIVICDVQPLGDCLFLVRRPHPLSLHSTAAFLRLTTQ